MAAEKNWCSFHELCESAAIRIPKIEKEPRYS
jgi:hypothetical protein